ncbi:MAG: ABC transporter permease [Caldilineaceae bacterium SB0670_bin_27]|uniref:ABC transporter permease n=1 Tax=Caldilineaceae bacterium SB0664_bin_27 TaxID=2605260 RepID=A0A6B0YNS6_9CHLR|nr:ABC transporter permease [Caldilineaceae bacterium SB0664_bin_27]MYJ78507.1 ABC transporter permease [Caldilineaceae bacterium SB0670_bin_27]
MVDSTATPADAVQEARQPVSSQISPDTWQALPKAENRFLRRFRRHRLAVLGLAALSLFALVAILAPFVTFYHPNGIDLTVMRQAPSTAHVLGTDPLGRDVWTRLAYGTRVSLAVGLVAVSIYTTIGVVLGGLAGYFGGRIDMVLSRFTDVMMCFPSFMLIVTVAVVLPPNIFNVMIIIGIFGWTGIMRHVRAQFLSLRERDFVLAARCVGVSSGRIVFRHILPNAIAPVVVAATMGLAGAIMTESALSFLGLGVQEPMSSWGSMLQDAMSLPILQTMPWLWLPSAVAIAITTLSVNFVGDALRDALDPHMSLD